jgi:hypothetical protein
VTANFLAKRATATSDSDGGAVNPGAGHTNVRSSSRWRWWWLPVLSVLVIGTGAVVAHRVWNDRDYSAAKMDCRDMEVRPLARLLGTGSVVPVEEDPDNLRLSCGFRVSGGGDVELGVGLITIVAATSRTPQQARTDFDRTDGPEGKEIDGIGQRATVLVMPVSSDAPEVMTSYLLHVLDGNLVLVVGLQAYSAALAADQTTVQRALIDVARNVMSALD